MNYMQLNYRSVTSKDSRFIRNLYCDSRKIEMTLVDWSKREKKMFLHEQFSLQQKHYDKTYPKANKQLIFLNDTAIGLFFTNVTEEEDNWHLIEISIAEPYRNQGVGRHILNHWIEEAKQQKAKVSLYVKIGNRAINLYKAFGFRSIESINGYLYLEL